jgi:hypothetical protein
MNAASEAQAIADLNDIALDSNKSIQVISTETDREL